MRHDCGVKAGTESPGMTVGSKGVTSAEGTGSDCPGGTESPGTDGNGCAVAITGSGCGVTPSGAPDTDPGGGDPSGGIIGNGVAVGGRIVGSASMIKVAAE